MYITVDDIEKEIYFYYPIDNRNGNKKVGLIRAYFVYSFYNDENDEKIHLKNGETLKVKRGSVHMKDIEKVSSGKVKVQVTQIFGFYIFSYFKNMGSNRSFHKVFSILAFSKHV